MESNRVCCNCLHLESEHVWDNDVFGSHCPTGDGGYYVAVMFVPFKNNLAYLERMVREKELGNI